MDSSLNEQWEKIIEYELEFYSNIQQYEDRLLERYYESQAIHYPTTVFDEDSGKVYLTCPGTEEQAIARMEAKAAIEGILRKAVKRINRLNRALAQLEKDELDIISIFYIERDLSELHMARTFGFRTKKEFMDRKTKVLKKLFAMYVKERKEVEIEFKRTLKEEIRRKAYLFQESVFRNKELKQSIF